MNEDNKLTKKLSEFIFAYAEMNMNASKTAISLRCSPSTVTRYIEQTLELTGLDVRYVFDLVELLEMARDVLYGNEETEQFCSDFKRGTRMKVRDLLKRFRMSSAVGVAIQVVPNGEEIHLTEAQVRDLKPAELMEMTVQTFYVREDLMTVYAKER